VVVALWQATPALPSSLSRHLSRRTSSSSSILSSLAGAQWSPRVSGVLGWERAASERAWVLGPVPVVVVLASTKALRGLWASAAAVGPSNRAVTVLASQLVPAGAVVQLLGKGRR
jgi:hypothetical protein